MKRFFPLLTACWVLLSVLHVDGFVWLCGTATAGEMQIGGTWQVTENGCFTDQDGQRDCSSGMVVIQVIQAGNQLSGSLFTEPDNPLDCSLTCNPVTENCAPKIELAGSISGSSVEFTLTAAQSFHAECDICTIDKSYSESFRAQGTVAGHTISGTFSDAITQSCDGVDPCPDEFDCVSGTASGTVDVQISAAATPTPTPSSGSCPGDCGGDGEVTADELLATVNIALGNATAFSCDDADVSSDGQITVDEILTALAHALSGCDIGMAGVSGHQGPSRAPTSDNVKA